MMVCGEVVLQGPGHAYWFTENEREFDDKLELIDYFWGYPGPRANDKLQASNAVFCKYKNFAW